MPNTCFITGKAALSIWPVSLATWVQGPASLCSLWQCGTCKAPHSKEPPKEGLAMPTSFSVQDHLLDEAIVERTGGLMLMVEQGKCAPSPILRVVDCTVCPTYQAYALTHVAP